MECHKVAGIADVNPATVKKEKRVAKCHAYGLGKDDAALYFRSPPNTASSRRTSRAADAYVGQQDDCSAKH